MCAELNALRLQRPSAIFSALYEAIQGPKKKVAPARARELLDKMFGRGGGRTSVICVVDEVDALAGGRQAVLYALLEWTARAGSRLAVIAVANTMDLPERLMPRLRSRVGVQRMTFATYTHQQLQQVIEARLEEVSLFPPNVVMFISRKVAAFSGDARRALQVARRATEVAEAAAAKEITIEHVKAAVAEMDAEPIPQLISRCSRHELIFLTALLTECGRSTIEGAARLSDAVTKHLDACYATKEQFIPNASVIADICARLSASHLVEMFRGPELEVWVRPTVAREDVARHSADVKAAQYLRA